MGLFDRNKKQLPELFAVAEGQAPITYDQVLEYLQGLSDSDFSKISSVAVIYRFADKRACEELEIEYKPTTFIKQPEAPAAENDQPLDFLHDDLETSFLEDPIPAKQIDIVKKGRAKAIEVNRSK